jgi:hypothetical protein
MENEEDLWCLVVLVIVLYYNSMRERSHLTRSAIQHPKLSPWARVYSNADDKSFLELTGMTRAAFYTLEALYFPSEIHVRKKRGRPRLLNTNSQLGLLLFYLNSTMKIKHLCLLFGVTPSTACEIINNMLKIQSKLFVDVPAHASSFPMTMKWRNISHPCLCMRWASR